MIVAFIFGISPVVFFGSNKRLMNMKMSITMDSKKTQRIIAYFLLALPIIVGLFSQQSVWIRPLLKQKGLISR